MEKAPDNKISLQKATHADIEAYITIDKKVGGKTYAAITEEKEVLQELAKGPVYLIKKGDEVVGTVSYEIKPDGVVYLSGLAIDPKYQSQGFGRQALEQVLAEVKDAPKVELLTHPDNVSAIKLYQSLGFEITERKEDYFGDKEPRIVLVKLQEQKINKI